MKKAELLEAIQNVDAAVQYQNIRITALEGKIKELTQALANLSHNTYPHKL